MNGESGTSHTNTTYRYYKCVNSRKKKCKKKPIAKEKIENAVIKRIMQFLEDEKAIDELVERIYELQFAENTYIPKLEEQITETQKRIDNLIKAAEQGFVSESSAKRLKELEETKKQQEIALIQEQIKTPLFTTDQIAFAIYKFRQLDLSTREAKQALIDGFVNAIYLYDDHAKLILNYKNDTKTITLDELQGSDFNSVTAPQKEDCQCRQSSFCVAETVEPRAIRGLHHTPCLFARRFTRAGSTRDAQPRGPYGVSAAYAYSIYKCAFRFYKE